MKLAPAATMPGMPAQREDLAGFLARYADNLVRAFSSGLKAQHEDQLKRPVSILIEEAGSSLRFQVRTSTEVLADQGRPDIGVAVSGLLAGHVELKAPGKGARPERFRDEADKRQWAKFRTLPNLVYTDGSEWALYRAGERKLLVTLREDLPTQGRKALEPKTTVRFEELFRDFLFWEPIVPGSPRALAELLAPLCHLLRDEVQEAAENPGSAIAHLARDWREALFPDADLPQFADAYAQTVTYALLLARFEGTGRLQMDRAEQILRRRHGLLAQALRVLGDPGARGEIALGLDLMERAIGAVDPAALRKHGADPWLYFYEDFLAKYDPKLRNDRGVYYTPVEVIQAQCCLAEELLRVRFERPLGFADEGVVLLDPACGTGAYLLKALQEGLDRVRQREGAGAVPGRATAMAHNIHGFEILVGPYAVAHLRLTQQLQEAGAELPADGVHVYLTDTLDSPHAEPRAFAFQHKPLADEHRRAQRVKLHTRVLVCLGNPPYDRQTIEPDDAATRRKGGWVRFAEKETKDQEERIAILEDFLEPARNAGAGVHLKNLYNDYVYFWRWALWKVFEQDHARAGDKQARPGIVTFISASSYLRGPGFVGMRRKLRELADEIWILDLEGDNLGARKTENVFAIQTPVAIALVVRYGRPQPEKPAHAHYTKLTGTRAEKLQQLAEIEGFQSLEWRDCLSGWEEPFLPQGEGNYFSWPLLTDLFPWQHSGVQFKRTWPIGETPDVLKKRWRTLLTGSRPERILHFRETRDRKATKSYPDIVTDVALTALVDLPVDADEPEVVRYSYRSFDRHWILRDNRLGDYLRPVLWENQSPEQLFVTSLLTGVLGLGPAATVTAQIPDLDHFRGSFGAKHVIPLYRDAEAKRPNVARGFLERLSAIYGLAVTPEVLLAYVYALLASPAYVARFSEELTNPGPRVPLTRDPALFRRGVELGRRLVWLHTYGDRWAPANTTPGQVPQGRARSVRAVPSKPEGYPEAFRYDDGTSTLHVGAGEFAPVDREIWGFSVSGLEVVKSWLAYRMKAGAGKKSSPLDEIRPERWTAAVTQELLELLWVLEATVALFPALAALLDEVVAGEAIPASELPRPSAEEREPPRAPAGPLFDESPESVSSEP